MNNPSGLSTGGVAYIFASRGSRGQVVRAGDMFGVPVLASHRGRDPLRGNHP
jgi:hypothetical protein